MGREESLTSPTSSSKRGLVTGLNVYRYQPVICALARFHPPTPMTLEISKFSESAHTDAVAEMEQIMGLGRVSSSSQRGRSVAQQRPSTTS